MEITIDELRDYLAAQGITLPDFVLAGLLVAIQQMDECMEKAGYPEAVAHLIRLYLLTLMAIPQAARYVSSESAPSGASRSYRYANINDHYKGILGLLRQLDTHGCAIGLVPPNPEAKSFGYFGVFGGGCD